MMDSRWKKDNSIDDGLVSVIVPVYLSENFLEKCIDSILGQTYKNIELILVDDGSPDHSGEICDCYAKKDKRVVVIHKKNGGVCAARNEGLKRARGRYLMFVDGDDYLSTDCIEYLLKILVQNNAEMSMSDCVFTTRNMEQNSNDRVRVLTPEEAACEILYDKTPVGPWNKMYSMSVVKDNNLSFSVKWFGEGLYFSVMNAQLSRSIAYGHRKVYVYRKDNPNSGTTVREIKNGLNALDNIIYIKKNLVVKTKKTINAANWHIWMNNLLVISYILGQNAKKEYLKEYTECKKYVRRNFLKVFWSSDLKLENKIKIAVRGLFPVLVCRYIVYSRRRLAKKDFKK